MIYWELTSELVGPRLSRMPAILGTRPISTSHTAWDWGRGAAAQEPPVDLDQKIKIIHTTM